VDKKSGIVRSQLFDARYREENPEYARGIEEMSATTKRTADPDSYGAYLQARARCEGELRKYRTDPRVLAAKIRRRENGQRTDGQLARMVAMASSDDVRRGVDKGDFSADGGFVDAVFFGDGAVNIRGKGHRGYSKKGVIRALACSKFPGNRRVQAVVINEWGTSSRCPCCKSGGRMEPKKITEIDKNKKQDTQPYNGQPSGSGTSSNPSVITESNKTNKMAHRDNRVEFCPRCKYEWPHDVVSVVNMLHISSHMIRGGGRPEWLARSAKQ
jgi:predicted Zn-ribbon and HTH transcriptional regulator